MKTTAFFCLVLAYYILAPLIPALSPPMFSKRPDKHTTGLINLRNDCFANSSVQAYSALPGLTEYLNQLYASYVALVEFIKSHSIDMDAVIARHLKDCDTSDKFRNSHPKLDVALHVALAHIVQKLQQTQMTSHTISVWTFLHTLEGIFNAKISRSQHDAQELTQLINETLEHENAKLRAYHSIIWKNLHDWLPHASVQEYKELERIIVPEFPFSGLILTQMKCLQCGGVSKPSLSPFVMLTLHTPETTVAELDSMLGENQQEQIEGYQCLGCRVKRIVAVERENRKEGDGKENENGGKFGCKNDQEGKEGENDENESSSLLSSIEQLSKSSFCINEDLPEKLEDFIRGYKRYGVDISKVTSTVFRKTQILKPPKIFGLHLSRSSFVDGSVTRNQCRVKFKDHLTLSIGKEYYDELQRFNAQAAPRATESSRVLTTDVDDMIDDDVQREDIDEKGEEDDDTETESGTDTGADDDDVTDTDSDSDSDDTDAETATITTNRTERTADGAGESAGDGSTLIEKKPESGDPLSLNNTPITAAQHSHLKEHFRRFKFNDNDVYKYRLKAMIRHQGSHTQGHYECYKHKPLFVKDAEGHTFKLSPEMVDIEGDGRFATTGEGAAVGKKSSVDEADEPGLRHRISSMMGRRPSVLQAHAENILEIVNLGLQTPAELLVGGLEKQPDYFSAYLEKQKQEPEKPAEPEKNVKMKKIPSLIKSPFWRISDAQVSEVSKDLVLLEQTSVYMLYYERVDRKQIRKT